VASMVFNEIRYKYFIIVEGEERAIIRDSAEQAEKVRKRLQKHSNGKNIYIYKASQKSK
jgi:hypothetical protein